MKKPETYPPKWITPLSDEEYASVAKARDELKRIYAADNVPPVLVKEKDNRWHIRIDSDYKPKTDGDGFLFALYQLFVMYWRDRNFKDVINMADGPEFLEDIQNTLVRIKKINFEPFSSLWFLDALERALSDSIPRLKFCYGTMKVGRPSEPHRELAKVIEVYSLKRGKLLTDVDIGEILLAMAIKRPDLNKSYKGQLRKIADDIKSALDPDIRKLVKQITNVKKV